jgi:hypothetical protein
MQIRDGKNSDPEFGINIPDPQQNSFMQIRDGKNSDPESGINIPDPQHCP